MTSIILGLVFFFAIAILAMVLHMRYKVMSPPLYFWLGGIAVIGLFAGFIYGML